MVSSDFSFKFKQLWKGLSKDIDILPLNDHSLIVFDLHSAMFGFENNNVSLKPILLTFIGLNVTEVRKCFIYWNFRIIFKVSLLNNKLSNWMVGCYFEFVEVYCSLQTQGTKLWVRRIRL